MRKLLLGLFFGLLTQAAFAQAPGSLPGCQYNATPPTLSDKQTTVWQCDSSGKLITSATATPPGGSNGQIQYNNAGAFGGITGATTNGTFVTLTTPVLGAATGTSLAVTGLLQAGTTIGISTDTFLSRLAAATWRLGAADAAAPVAQTLGVQGVVAGTANTAGANLIIAGSVSTGSAAGGSIIFQTAAAGGAGSGQNALANTLSIGPTRLATIFTSGTVNDIISLGTSNQIISTASNGLGISFRLYGDSTGSGGPARMQFGSTGTIEWNSAAGLQSGSIDLVLQRDAANTLALRNSTTAQTFNLYATFTDASNKDYVSITKAAGGAAVISTIGAGTGTGGDLIFGVPVSAGAGVATTNVWKIGAGASAGALLAVTTNTYDIGTSVTVAAPRTVYAGTSFKAPVYVSAGAVPTLTLAGGTCAGTVIAGGSTAGTVTLTGVCVATNTMALTVMPTAPTGYACDAIDRTLGSSLLTETATTATSVTFTFGGTTGATDVLAYKCLAY